MTNHTVRLYAVALALAVFFLTWAVVAAKPFGGEPNEDPRVVALERREAELRRKSIRVQRIVNRRFAAYRVRLKRRQAQIAAVNAANAAAAAAPLPVASSGGSSATAPAAPAAPSVGVVSLPPATQTRSS
ncbi:MAG: hypothetical protein M3188_04045 [Actinomycetota bacterium]|nr:hypothetical protein [Actinomycetota bacterium]